MTVQCPHCSRVLEFSGEPPSFCGYCGRPLRGSSVETTIGSSPPAAVAATVAYLPAGGVAVRDPETIAGYRLLRTLGRGGMGTVYEAEEDGQGRRVALKLVSAEVVASAEAVERFRQEGRLASAISHPRCVFVLAADEAEGRPYIVMELMAGSTLAERVEREGPLAPGEAVSKILDVAEGLQEAHRLGVIHRDVKPSNCFLDGDGRVKVGDFGLSKSLGGDIHLTRTGSFLGTPLYASPEQIRGDPLDGRTDVYSTCATLYFLLTGKAPFEQRDAAATMARIVSEPAPSARSVRADIPPELDRVIQRGLERDRDRRYRDMAELIEALRPFVARPVTPAPRSLRLVAGVLDTTLLSTPCLAYFLLVDSGWTSTLVDGLASFTYFASTEAAWGASLGKYCARLRVFGAEAARRSSPPAIVLRAAIFATILLVPDIVADVAWERLPPFSVFGGYFAALAASVLVVGSTMRARNGFRGPHELLSGTRVVRLPRGESRRGAERRRKLGRDRGTVRRPLGVTEAIGPYRVRGAVRWEPDRKVLAGEDTMLGREVWVVIRPRSSPPPPAARRDLARASRPRWLTGGEQAEGRWDAYLAPAGMPLADLAGPDGLPWHEARPILEDLADELAAACRDGTLPPGLTVDQVWVEPDGRTQIVDPLGLASTDGADPAGAGDDERALSLLRRVAALALEGGRRHRDEEPTTIRSAVPLHARDLLDRLTGGADRYARVEPFRDDLAASRDLPAEVRVADRAMGLGLLAFLMLPPLSLMFGLSYLVLSTTSDSWDLPINDTETWDFWPAIRLGAYLSAVAFPLGFVLWSTLTRGGFSKSLLGLALVRHDGPRASRLRCGWRCLAGWLVPAALLVLSLWTRASWPNRPGLHLALFGAAAAALVLEIGAGLLSPQRGLHDWLAGTRLVPK